MVVQQTLNKIEELKERPHHERRHIARTSAIIVVAFLLFVWGFFAVRRIGNFAVGLKTQQQAAAQAAAAASANTTATSPAEQLVASSTDGYVDLVPASQAPVAQDPNQGSK